MPARQSGAVDRCLHQALLVLWPAEWRVTMTRSGLYLIEANAGDGWWLERMCFRLGDAFALGESLHKGPRRFAGLPAATAVLPETYRVSTDDNWQGRAFRAALEENPFPLDVQPEDAFRSQVWDRALGDALNAVVAGQSVVVTGGPGAGKSLFLRELARVLEQRGTRVARTGDAADGGQLLLLDGSDAPPESLPRGCQAVLATEDAQAVPAWLATAARVELGPFTLEEVARFVAGRLRAAGRFGNWPEPDAILALFRHSRGVPRDLIMLAGAAAFLADLEYAPRLSVQHVEHAAAVATPGGAQLPPWPAPATQPGVAARPWLLPGLRLAAACAGLALVLLTSWSARWVSVQADLAQLEQQRAPAADMAAPAEPAIAGAEPAPAAPAREAPVEEALDDSFDSNVAVTGAAPEGERPRATQPGVGLSWSGATLISPAALGSFRGPVNNETLRLTGKLALDVSRDPASGAVRARFHAWNGLLGTGQLTGSMTPDGRVMLSGQLLMGRNPFLCTLTGTIQGDHFIGSAQFVRPWGGRIAHSSFSLLRT